MSEDPTHGTHTIRASKSSGGGAGKWLIGAAAAAVITGGGYLAYKNYAPGPNTEIAYNDSGYADDDTYRAGPLPSSSLDDTASTDESAPAGAAPASASSERRAQTRRAAAAPRAEPVPEATIGITPVSATTDETEQGDDIIVNAPPRPVWASAPSERRLAALYPKSALERGREGDARLQCTVLDGGSLDCTRVEQSSNSFGYAAMRVARTLRHADTRADGTSAVGTPVNLHVVFQIEEEDRARFASR